MAANDYLNGVGSGLNIGADQRAWMQLAQQNAARKQQEQIQQQQMQQRAKEQQFNQALQMKQMQAEAMQNQMKVRGDIAKSYDSAGSPDAISAVDSQWNGLADPQQLAVQRNARLSEFQAEGWQQIPDPTQPGKMKWISPTQYKAITSGPQAGGFFKQQGDKPPQFTPPPNAGMGAPSTDAKTQIWANTVLGNAAKSPGSVPPEVVKAAQDWKEANELSPEATQMYADIFLQTGQLPSMGSMGSAKIRTHVMNQIGTTAKTLGLGAGDVIAAGAEVAANKGALTNLTKQQAGMEAFSGFLDKQLDSLDSTLKAVEQKVSLYDASILNTPVLSWQKNIQGLPEVQAYLQQLQSTRTEAARLVSSAGATGAVLPVQFEQEWNDIISPNAAPGRIEAFIRQMRVDKVNRQQAFEDERQTLVDKFKKNQDPKKVQQFTNAMSQPSQGQQVPGTGDDTSQ